MLPIPFSPQSIYILLSDSMWMSPLSVLWLDTLALYSSSYTKCHLHDGLLCASPLISHTFSVPPFECHEHDPSSANTMVRQDWSHRREFHFVCDWLYPLVFVICSALPWGWCGNNAANIITHFVKLCMETEGNSIILLNDVKGSYHLISALPCRQMTTAWSHGFIKSNASTLPSKMQQTRPLTANYFLVFWNWLELSLKSCNIAFTEKIQQAQQRTLK